MPTSVLWVTLIAVWLFVLIPMVLRGRPQARKTTAAAANTRLVHRGGSARTAASRTEARARAAQRAAAKAEEHRKQAAEAKAAAEKKAAEKQAAEKKAADEAADAVDPVDEVEDETGPTLDAELVDDQTRADESAETEHENDDIVDAEVEDEAEVEAEAEAASESEEKIDVVSAAELTDQIPVVEDDVVDIDQAHAVRDADHVPELEDEAVEDGAGDSLEEILDDHEDAEYEDAEYDDTEYDDTEYDDTEYDDTEYEDEPEPVAPPREVRGRGGHGPERVAEREAMQYRERQRMVLGFAVVTLAAIVSAFFFQPWGIAFACGMVAAFVTYLWLLRRAVREEQARQALRAARRRRQQEEDARLESRQAEPTYVAPPARLRRPGGAIVLEIDDEDPAFDHLPTYDFAQAAGYDDEYDEHDRAVYGRTAV